MHPVYVVSFDIPLILRDAQMAELPDGLRFLYLVYHYNTVLRHKLVFGRRRAYPEQQ